LLPWVITDVKREIVNSALSCYKATLRYKKGRGKRKDEREMKELDLRTVPVNERSPDKIINAWKELAEGDTLKLINDHDPKPLRYMFQIEFKDAFAWEYKLEGPNEWIVEIKKIGPSLPLSPEQKKKRDELK